MALSQDLLSALLVLLLSNLLLLVDSVDYTLVSRLPKELLATLLSKSLASRRDLGRVVHFLHLWVFDLLLGFSFKLHSVRVQSHEMIVKLCLASFANQELSRSILIVILILLVKHDSLDSCRSRSVSWLINLLLWNLAAFNHQQRVIEVISSNALVILAVKEFPQVLKQLVVTRFLLKIAGDESKRGQDSSDLVEAQLLIRILGIEFFLVISHILNDLIELLVELEVRHVT